MVEHLGEYKYGGFRYTVVRTTNCDGRFIHMEPFPGSPKQAGSDLNRRSARFLYLDDHPQERGT